MFAGLSLNKDAEPICLNVHMANFGKDYGSLVVDPNMTGLELKVLLKYFHEILWNNPGGIYLSTNGDNIENEGKISDCIQGSIAKTFRLEIRLNINEGGSGGFGGSSGSRTYPKKNNEVVFNEAYLEELERLEKEYGLNLIDNNNH